MPRTPTGLMAPPTAFPAPTSARRPAPQPRRHAGWVLAVLVERGGQDLVFTGGYVFGGDDLLHEHADKVVHVVEAVVAKVKGVTAEAGPVGEDDAFGAGARDVDLRADRVGAVTDVDGLGLGNLRGAGEVDVA